MESITVLKCELYYSDSIKFWFTCKTEHGETTEGVTFTVHRFLWFFIVRLQHCDDVRLLEHTAVLLPKVLKSLRKAPFYKIF